MKGIKYLVLLACLPGFAAALQAQTCNASVPAATPSSDFTVHGDGTVTHAATGLMWQQCALGLSGSTCSSGSAAASSWSAALSAAVADRTAGYGDWRLPNLKELRSLVEEKCYGPSINATIFPNTPVAYFWSASASAGYLSYAWYVHLGSGFAYYASKGNALQVRLVRAGQPFASFDSYDTVPLTVIKTGAGSVSGAPINCGSTCSGKAGRDFDVTLTATPATNLSAWGGACTGATPTCTVRMDAAKTVLATFLDAPIVSATPSALSFAPQNVGSTSAAQAATLSNSGTTALTIGSINASGDFALTHNCPGTVAVGASCTLTLRFAPTASGTHSGSVQLTSNAPGSPQSILALSGTGLATAGVALSPASLTFADQRQGSPSAAQTVTLRNSGSVKLVLNSISASGDFAVTHDCGTGLEADAVCSISVIFTPSALGPRTGSVIISSNAIGNPHSVGLAGTGISANTPLCSLNAAPAQVQPGRSTTLKASCTPDTLAYSWTGGTCADQTTATCTDKPALTTAYSVTGSNAYGASTATVTVTVKSIDLTPILMLLLD